MVSHLAGMKTILTPWSVVIAFSIPGAVGVAFGLYLTKSVALLNRIEGLRHEC